MALCVTHHEEQELMLGDFEYVLGEGYAYNAAFDFSDLNIRPVEFHYDESLAEEFEEVFENAPQEAVVLNNDYVVPGSSNDDTPATGVALNVGFAMICVAVVAGLALVSFKRKEQY